MRKAHADADTHRAEGEGARQSRERGAGRGGGVLNGRPRADGPRAPAHSFFHSGSPTPKPGRDVSQRGTNELQDLSITSPEPSLIGWPSRRGGLLL